MPKTQFIEPTYLNLPTYIKDKLREEAYINKTNMTAIICSAITQYFKSKQPNLKTDININLYHVHNKNVNKLCSLQSMMSFVQTQSNTDLSFYDEASTIQLLESLNYQVDKHTIPNTVESVLELFNIIQK